jgi:hypothetical protein
LEITFKDLRIQEFSSEKLRKRIGKCSNIVAYGRENTSSVGRVNLSINTISSRRGVSFLILYNKMAGLLTAKLSSTEFKNFAEVRKKEVRIFTEKFEKISKCFKELESEWRS